MQQTLQSEADDRPTNAIAERRRRIVRELIGAGLIAVALSWFLVDDVKVWRGPNYGVLLEVRGDLLCEWLYRTDVQSVECSVWRIYDETMQAAPIVLVRTGRHNHVEIGDSDNW